MDPIKEFSKTVLSLDNLIIPNERLLNTPSSKDGVSHELEVDLRIVGCEYIQSAGLLLKLPQVAMATAQVIFQRFYYSKSFVKYSVQPMAMACIFLAAKIEEDCRRLRDVINVFHHLRQKRMGRHIVPMEYMGEEYFKAKSTVIKYERFLLKELGFCVHVKHPHKTIITYLQILEMEKNTRLAQRAWNFMNDSLRTNVFIRFSPETIACACIYLAARQLKLPLPQRPPWWLVFDADDEDIEAICYEILALYTRPKRFLEDLEKQIGVLREKLMEKKQIEIKEVNLKKKSDSKPSSKNASPNTGGETMAATTAGVRDRSTSKSPVPQPPRRSPLLPHPMSSLALASKGGSQKGSPIRNGDGNKPTRSPPQRPRSRSQNPTPPQQQQKSHSSSSSEEHSSSPQAYKPIQGPIQVSSSDHSDHTPSPPPQENGVPAQYKVDFEHDRRVRKSRHKHRSEKKHRHHDRSRSREREHKRRHRDRERERERDYFREVHRSRDRGRDRRGDVYRYR